MLVSGDITGDRSVKKTSWIRVDPADPPAWPRSPHRRYSGGVAAVVNIDGSIFRPEEARVSVFDRGFLYGDSVYEVVRTYDGRPFELQAHLARLASSAHRIALALPWDAPRTAEELQRTLEASRGGDPDDREAAPWNRGERTARIVMTRGSGEPGLDPALAARPTCIVIVQPIAAPPASAYRDGVAACVVGVPRAPPSVADPGAKTGLHLPHVLAVAEARARGAHEALLTDGAGRVTEGASSNLFAVLGGRLLTPPLAAGILEGVTRGVVLRLAQEEGLAPAEVELPVAGLADVQELFITSTAREILPVTRLDGRPVASGRVGPMTRRLHEAFRALASSGGGVGGRGSAGR
jgi:branched-chain amino acid aminotransferase